MKEEEMEKERGLENEKVVREWESRNKGSERREK